MVSFGIAHFRTDCVRHFNSVYLNGRRAGAVLAVGVLCES